MLHNETGAQAFKNKLKCLSRIQFCLHIFRF